ncbi:hypothetical protein FDG2_0033 [Candidatus Protofrankia californiensis]|uniref:ArnR1-like winged helix-turn-helix domain-containing protein n=1 Tax=Candidatus Protofrankia californiensis TaxID=1839754 RepID=A0A1C3NST3_9ACTN|nr:hypothetical protein FDG2_0033 [Candidatus Protofrankia californiensis]
MPFTQNHFDVLFEIQKNGASSDHGQTLADLENKDLVTHDENGYSLTPSGKEFLESA